MKAVWIREGACRSAQARGQTAMSEFSFDTGSETFVDDVIAASHAVPVVVDFWAPWCAPCRSLKPILEKLAVEYAGRFRLAKVNTDEHPEVSARYGVRGIPNVKAFVDGELADEFTGALPEAGVREFIERLLPGPDEQARRAGVASLAAGDFDAAEAKLREALQLDARNDAARVDLAEVLVAGQDEVACEEAERLLAEVLSIHRDARVERLEAQIGIVRKRRALPPLAALHAAVQAQPQDASARLAYAQRLMADGYLAEALDAFLEVVQRDRGALREQARQDMLEAFNLVADRPDLVSDYRRRLARALH